MRVIALHCQKGGAGKSLCAAHLAVCAARRKKTVAVLDLDPQGTLLEWAAERGSEDVAVEPARIQELPTMLGRARDQGVDLVLLDTPGRQDVLAARVMALSEIVLIPCRPYMPDVRAAPKTAAEVKRAGKVGYFVLNACPSRGSRHVEARAVLEQLLPVAPIELGARNVFADALNDGRSVEELEPSGKAAEEVRALYRWISRLEVGHG
jgi:chromosome partitioning protein